MVALIAGPNGIGCYFENKREHARGGQEVWERLGPSWVFHAITSKPCLFGWWTPRPLYYILFLTPCTNMGGGVLSAQLFYIYIYINNIYQNKNISYLFRETIFLPKKKKKNKNESQNINDKKVKIIEICLALRRLY